MSWYGGNPPFAPSQNMAPWAPPAPAPPTVEMIVTAILSLSAEDRTRLDGYLRGLQPAASPRQFQTVVAPKAWSAERKRLSDAYDASRAAVKQYLQSKGWKIVQIMDASGQNQPTLQTNSGASVQADPELTRLRAAAEAAKNAYQAYRSAHADEFEAPPDKGHRGQGRRGGGGRGARGTRAIVG